MSASAIHGLQAAISTVKAAYPVEQHAGLHQALNGAMQASQSTLSSSDAPKTLKGASEAARKMFADTRPVSSGGGPSRLTNPRTQKHMPGAPAGRRYDTAPRAYYPGSTGHTGAGGGYGRSGPRPGTAPVSKYWPKPLSA